MKKCKECKKIKSKNDFYGVQGECKECTKKRIKKYRLENIDKISDYDKLRYQNPERKKYSQEQSKQWRKKNPERMKEFRKKWEKNNPEKIKESRKNWKINNREKVREINRRAYKNNREKRIEYASQYRKDNPEKVFARNMVKKALRIRNGTLERLPCEVCKHPNAHAHHEDYSKPLDVRWFCPIHHAEVHKN